MTAKTERKALIVDRKAAKAMAATGQLPAVVFDYVFDPGEKELLEKFVGMQTNQEDLRRYPNLRLRAVALGVPVERLEHWRKTKEYLQLMGMALQIMAVEGVAQALPGQVALASSIHLEGSTRALEAVAKIARVMKPDNAPDNHKDEQAPAGSHLTIENLLIQVAMERQEPKKVIDAGK